MKMNIKKYKQQMLNELYKKYQNCKLCPLNSMGRKNIIFGEGNPDSKVLLIGEGPGKNEDILGRPFVGRSGQLLTKSLEALGIKREDIYITNIIKCRPPNNRTPLPIETKTCKKLLFQQIKIIRPKIICTLGACAIKALLEKPVKITQIRGKVVKKDFFYIIPTYHPAYILRNNRELSTFIADLKISLDYI